MSAPRYSDAQIARAVREATGESVKIATTPRHGVMMDRGTHFAIKLRCPDGTVRLFRTSRGSRPDRRAMRADVRFGILERDGFACRYCGARAPDAELVVDHVVPVAAGGTDDPTNLVTACQDCNAGKSDRILS